MGGGEGRAKKLASTRGIRDIPAIVNLIASDPLGKLRENRTEPLSQCYYNAFEHIAKDSNQMLIVMENDTKEIIGTLQLTFIRYLTYQGGLRAQIEGVRIREDARGKQLGEKIIQWAIQKARDHKAHLVQLTTDKKRPKAVAFYRKLGFVPSHEGMKLHLNPALDETIFEN